MTDFSFTEWYDNKDLQQFQADNRRDLTDHDRCPKCNIWVNTLCVGLKEAALLVQCPNCGFEDLF